VKWENRFIDRILPLESRSRSLFASENTMLKTSIPSQTTTSEAQLNAMQSKLDSLNQELKFPCTMVVEKLKLEVELAGMRNVGPFKRLSPERKWKDGEQRGQATTVLQGSEHVECSQGWRTRRPLMEKSGSGVPNVYLRTS
jgi:hypothetical protein